VTIRDVANFTLERRRSFDDLVRAVPHDIGLAELDEPGLGRDQRRVPIRIPGAWSRRSPRSQRCIARTRSVLDGYVALAFGFARDGSSSRGRRDVHELVLLSSPATSHVRQVVTSTTRIVDVRSSSTRCCPWRESRNAFRSTRTSRK